MSRNATVVAARFGLEETRLPDSPSLTPLPSLLYTFADSISVPSGRRVVYLYIYIYVVHGESAWVDAAELGGLRAHWIIGPPCMDHKSLVTMCIAAGLWCMHTLLATVGLNLVVFNTMSHNAWVQTLLSSIPCLGANPVVFNTVSPITENAFSKRNASYWIVRVLVLADFCCRWISRFWRR